MMLILLRFSLFFISKIILMKYSLYIFGVLISCWFVFSQYFISRQSERENYSPGRIISMSKGQSLSDMNTGFFVSQYDQLHVYYNEAIKDWEEIHIAYTGMDAMFPVFVYKNRLGLPVYSVAFFSEEDRNLLVRSKGDITITKDMSFSSDLCSKFIPFYGQRYCFLLWRQVWFYVLFLWINKDWFSISIQ